MFWIVILYALLALTFTLSKYAVTVAHPLYFISVRMVIAGIILLAAQLAFSGFPKRLKIRIKDASDFVQIILFHIYIAFVPEFWALQFVSSIKVNILYSLTPFFGMAFAYFLFRERITKFQFLGSMIAFAGILPLMLKGEGFCLQTLTSISVPELVLLAAVASSAYAWFVVKRLMDKKYSLLTINGVGMFFGGILSSITWLLVKEPNTVAILAWWQFIAVLIALIVLSNIVVYGLYGWLIKKYPIHVVAVAGFMCPVFGAIYGMVFLGETVAWQHAIALVGVTIGLYFFFYTEIRKKQIARAERKRA